MSMMCEMPSRATFAMFSSFQIPPPTAIRPVTHVISIALFPSSGQSTPSRNCVAEIPELAPRPGRLEATDWKPALTSEVLILPNHSPLRPDAPLFHPPHLPPVQSPVD